MVLGTVLPNVRHKGGEKVIIGCAKEMNKQGRTQEVGHPIRRPTILPTQRRLTATMYRYPECRRGTLESQDLVQHKSSILDNAKHHSLQPITRTAIQCCLVYGVYGHHSRISKSFLPQNGHAIGTNGIYGGGSNRNSTASNLQELQLQVNRSNAATPEPGAVASTSSQFGQARSESPEPLKEAHTTHNWRHSSGPQGAIIRGPQDGNGFTRLRGESVNTIEMSSTDRRSQENLTTASDNNTATPTPQGSDDDETPPDEEDGKR
ncbi:unnamed protein product [Umbelopsis ramanniana]